MPEPRPSDVSICTTDGDSFRTTWTYACCKPSAAAGTGAGLAELLPNETPATTAATAAAATIQGAKRRIMLGPCPVRTGTNRLPPYDSSHNDLLRDPPRARRRALRQDGRLLQGQPERDGHRRPPRRPRPPRRQVGLAGDRRETADPRPPKAPRHRDVPGHRRAAWGLTDR